MAKVYIIIKLQKNSFNFSLNKMGLHIKSCINSKLLIRIQKNCISDPNKIRIFLFYVYSKILVTNKSFNIFK